MAPEVLNRVCYGRNRPEAWQVRSRTVTPAILPDYCRHKVRHCDYPAIIRSEGGSVRGTFVTGLTAGDIWRLDIFEGSQYKRIKVSVKLLAKVHEDSGTTHAEGDEVEAETYVWIESEDDLEDGEWDFVEFQREKMRRWTGQSDEYTGAPCCIPVVVSRPNSHIRSR